PYGSFIRVSTLAQFYTLSLHDALPIWGVATAIGPGWAGASGGTQKSGVGLVATLDRTGTAAARRADRQFEGVPRPTGAPGERVGQVVRDGTSRAARKARRRCR